MLDSFEMLYQQSEAGGLMIPFSGFMILDLFEINIDNKESMSNFG